MTADLPDLSEAAIAKRLAETAATVSQCHDEQTWKDDGSVYPAGVPEPCDMCAERLRDADLIRALRSALSTAQQERDKALVTLKSECEGHADTIARAESAEAALATAQAMLKNRSTD